MKTFRIVACGLAVAAMTWLGARTATAGTVYVDNNLSDYAGHDGSSWQLAYKTIQEGVNAAADGDTVLVAPGTYGDDQGTRVYLPLTAFKGAADFSGWRLQDAPAGKYGWLKRAGGHFEFEGRSVGERVKFYGVNLVGSGKKV